MGVTSSPDRLPEFTGNRRSIRFDLDPSIITIRELRATVSELNGRNLQLQDHNKELRASNLKLRQYLTDERKEAANTGKSFLAILQAVMTENRELQEQLNSETA